MRSAMLTYITNNFSAFLLLADAGLAFDKILHIKLDNTIL